MKIDQSAPETGVGGSIRTTGLLSGGGKPCPAAATELIETRVRVAAAVPEAE